MNHAQNEPGTGSVRSRLTPEGARPLSGLLPRLRLDSDGTWEITQLASSAERAKWAANVYVCLRSSFIDDELSGGRAIRDRVVVALRYLAKRGSVTHPVSKGLWNKLYLLTTMCAHEPDWSSPSGPLMGASNKTLEDRWNVSNARRILRDLAGWGFVIPFCPKGNGHRSYKKTKDGPVGAGWSLAPLRLLVGTLEGIVEREEHLRLLRLEIPDRIKSAIGAIRALVSPFRDSCGWAAVACKRLEDLCKQRDRTNRGALSALEACLQDALSLLQDVENQLIDTPHGTISGEEASTRTDTFVQYLYNESTTDSVGNGSAGSRSGNDLPSPTTVRKVATSRESFQDSERKDVFGIVRSGFTWAEAPHLFPFHAGMIDITRGPVNGTVEVLARLIGVSTMTAASAERRIGREAATICLLMTGQHHADGMILKTPEAYLRGIIRKAGAGELNIGHSLFGRRERAGTESEAHQLM